MRVQSPARAAPSGQGATVALGENTRIDLPLRMTAAQPVELGIRPEHLHLVVAETGDIAGKALLVEYLGNTSYAYIETAFGQVIVEADGLESIETGTAVGLSIDRDKAHVFDQTGLALSRA